MVVLDRPLDLDSQGPFLQNFKLRMRLHLRDQMGALRCLFRIEHTNREWQMGALASARRAGIAWQAQGTDRSCLAVTRGRRSLQGVDELDHGNQNYEPV